MRRQENQAPIPTTDWRSVPLFNQKKRNRIPLTSTPSENEFFSHSEFMASSSSATSQPGGYPQASGPSPGGFQTLQWNKKIPPQSSPSQQYGSNRPAPGPTPAARACGLMPHPSAMGLSSNPVRQQDSNFNFKQNKYPQSAPSKPAPHAGLSQKGQQPYRPPNSVQQYCQPRPPPPPAAAPVAVLPPRKPSAPTAQPQKNSWKFTNSFEALGSSFEGKMSTKQSQTVKQTPSQQGKLPMKPAVENSLRILTAVIEGMRHWSKFKDRVPYLFEIFATLDSAVTLGRYGAKSFLMRDGKDVVQCVFYENEWVLPRLIRGQVHRCVGNYDRSRDVLVCVSVRPGLPSELRNALEAVKACDAEMRVLVKSFSEV
ncbi:spermatogenesis-associated protein 22 [Salarias fasciatus]|uniref:spermatogenesis-associated protein 22 n=1 Tax=Salarias fasciatus TaxID=181472 RepID=UPI001176AE40|nr:spermatogenesis-associated protein 22 [Salarias fasciatus]